MNIPAWADQQLSKDLAEFRSRGEGQYLEFKQEFPQNTSDLAKEIAAFATSNTGTILIGVKDNGDLVGLNGMKDAKARDSLLRRLEGICRASVKPAVTPKATWVVESGRIVLAVTVPKGSEPVYYSEGKPYLRHITSSQSAEPHEVVDLVRLYLDSRLEPDNIEQDEESAFFSELGPILHRVLAWAEAPPEARHMNPWLEEWRADYGYAGSELRELASKDVAVRLGLDTRIHEVAEALNEVSAFQLTLGNSRQLEDAASHASEVTSGLKRDTVDKIPLSEQSVAQARSLIAEISRRLSDLINRAQKIVNAERIEELQSDVGSMGRELVQLSFYDLTGLGRDISRELREAGISMWLIETSRVYMDGGASIRRIVEAVAHCKNLLNELTERMESSSAASPL